MATRNVGDRVPVRYEARDADGELTSGATAVLTVVDPAGATTNPAVTQTATGLHDASFTLSQLGLWQWYWTVSGAIVDVTDPEHLVASTPPPATYVGLPALRSAMNIPEGDRDELLLRALSTAARMIDEYTGRPPGGFAPTATATARTFEVCDRVSWDSGRYVLKIDDISSLTDLAVETGDGTTWTAVTSYRVHPLNALAALKPVTALSSLSTWGTDLVRVTARWGWPSTPDQVAQATLMQAVRLYRRKDSPEGIAGVGDFGPVRVATFDPDVRELLAPYRPVLIA